MEVFGIVSLNKQKLKMKEGINGLKGLDLMFLELIVVN
jgi:hypothetical protein